VRMLELLWCRCVFKQRCLERQAAPCCATSCTLPLLDSLVGPSDRLCGLTHCWQLAMQPVPHNLCHRYSVHAAVPQYTGRVAACQQRWSELVEA
jgi:hypothetical protein